MNAEAEKAKDESKLKKGQAAPDPQDSLEPCDKAFTPETFRSENVDEACDDGVH
jgi:hypothetical protein